MSQQKLREQAVQVSSMDLGVLLQIVNERCPKLLPLNEAGIRAFFYEGVMKFGSERS